MEVIGTITSRHYDFILGREKSLSEKDQYAVVIVMYPPNSIRKGWFMGEIGKYIVETGSLDEISKYKEIGAFSEWPFFRLSFSPYSPKQDLNDRDMKFIRWMEKTLKEYVPKPKMKVEHGSRIWKATHGCRKKPWWKRLVGWGA